MLRTDTETSWRCTCNAGYIGNGVVCDDIDECAEQIIPFDAAACTDFVCSAISSCCEEWTAECEACQREGVCGLQEEGEWCTPGGSCPAGTFCVGDFLRNLARYRPMLK